MSEISLIPKNYKGKTELGTIFSKIGILILVLVIISLSVYAGLFFYEKSLNKQVEKIQSQIEEINKQRDIEFEKETISLEKNLKELKIILKNHLYWSNIFSKIENLVVPQVIFSKLEGDTKSDGSADLTLEGKTLGYTYLAKQMVSFSQDDMVSNVEVSKINVADQGGIEFNLNINFIKNILSRTF